MAQYRYPENIDAFVTPWLLFTTQRPQYKSRVRSTSAIAQQKLGDSVALYFPTNHGISDSLNYDTYEGGLVGGVINNMSRTSDVTPDDVRQVAQTGLGKAGRSISNVLGGDSGRALYDRSRGLVTNPREFMLFKSPGIREFSFSFQFIPQSFGESYTLPEIIKFFRKASYPRQHSGGLDFVFPDTFTIQYKQVNESIIRMPEVACTAINVTYNPNTSSFFEVNNSPVETTLELTFTELRPITRELVEAGY